MATNTTKRTRGQHFALRRCKGCGTPEKRNGIGYTNISPNLGYCCACITRAMRAQQGA